MREERFDPPLALAADARKTELKVPVSAASLSAVAQGCWIETRQVDVSPNDVVLRAWPLATLSAAYERIKPEPSAVRVAFVDTAAGENERLQELTCTRDGAVATCELPAGRTMHVRVEWAGFAPVYAKNVAAREGAVVDLGAADLAPAYNVSGRVAARDGTAIAGALVRLLPSTAGEMTKAERVLRTIEAGSDTKGNYRLSGVAPGLYRLVSQVARRADAVIDPLRVTDRDLAAPPLVHTPRARLEIVLSPPVAPDGTPWKVEVSRRGTRQFERLVVASATVPVSGSWRSEPLENADYTVTISNRAGSEVARQERSIDGEDELLLITVAGISVSGRILAGDDGVVGDVAFSAPSGQTIRVKTAKDGSFGALFPHPGSWRVEVVIPPSSMYLRLPAVEIRENHQESLEIRLPAGRIEGTVVDSRGKPAVVGVSVTRDRRSLATGVTSDDGTFVIEHVPEGKCTLSVTSNEWFVPPVEVTVTEEEPAKVHLVLQPSPTLKGVVTGPSGRPLSGAVVRVVELDTTRREDKIADAEGRFAVKLRTMGMIDVIVLAPPAPVLARRFAPPQWHDQLVSLTVPATSATLRLLLLQSPPWPILTSADGAARPLGLFLMPRFGSSAVMQEFIDGAVQFTIEPGAYTLCLASDCRRMVLHPGSVETITFIPRPEKP